MTIYFVDQVGGNDGNNGTAFGQRWLTLNGGTGAGSIAAGDSVRFMATPAATDAGITATFTNKSLTVTLASSLTKLITNCDTVWSASTNVTATAGVSSQKEGTKYASLSIASAFTTGLVAFFATGTLDLSAFRQISFWMQATSTPVSSGVFSVKLCSDIAGVTPVYTFIVNRALNAAQWTAITIDNGSTMTLATAIKSVAVYAISDPGTQGIAVDDIIACNSPTANNCLTLNSLVYAGSTGIPFAVKSINGTTVVLDQYVNSFATLGRGWSGTTGSYELYVRQPIATASVSTTLSAVQSYVGANPSSGSHVTISGGWDSTAMTTQSGDTFLDGVDGFGTLFIGSSSTQVSYIDYSKFSWVRYNAFGSAGSGVVTGGTYTNLVSVACSSFGIPCSQSGSVSNCIVVGNSGSGFILMTTSGGIGTFSSCQAYGCNYGLDLTGTGYGTGVDTITCSNHGANGLKGNSGSNSGSPIGYFRNITANDNSGAAFTNCLGLLENVTTAGNTQTFATQQLTIIGLSSTDSVVASIGASAAYLYNVTYTGTLALISGSRTTAQPMVIAHRLNGNPLLNGIYSQNGQGTTQTSVIPTGASVAWDFTNLTTTDSLNSLTNPVLSASILRIPAKANVTHNLTFNVRRNDATINGRLRIGGGRYPGIGSVGSDITVAIAPTINTWATVTLGPFTPTVDCVIEVWIDVTTASASNKHLYLAGPMVWS